MDELVLFVKLCCTVIEKKCFINKRWHQVFKVKKDTRNNADGFCESVVEYITFISISKDCK